MTKYGKIAIASLILLILIPITCHNVRKYLRDNRARYSIGISTGVYNAGRGGVRINFVFYYCNKKYFEDDFYENAAKRKNGRYFVRFDSLHPSNAVLLQDFPVPDSIKTAPPNGWKEIPVKYDSQ
jgi:hypothetical protein